MQTAKYILPKPTCSARPFSTPVKKSVFLLRNPKKVSNNCRGVDRVSHSTISMDTTNLHYSISVLLGDAKQHSIVLIFVFLCHRIVTTT